MNPAEQREEAVFEAALKLPAEQRPAYLAQACAGDAELRRRVEVLLGAFERAGGFMNQPATPERTARISLPPTEKPGDRIGRYKLLEQIGEGGCGVVYVAEQEEPVRRRVALKVIKLGMDTKQVIARFDAERQALAMMDHPNIAKIHDAGVTDAPLPASGHPLPSSDEGRGQGEESPLVTRHSSLVTSSGRPYFVMELVRGIKITDYCDQNQLAPRERLDLFIQVCRAIQHAHQKGIIHRDIKPSNILVTLHDGVPVPKVIDFGIAKATQGRLTDQTVYTAFEQFIGTPAYMSPEQAEMSGLDIDTRSDIYSLGVLLYELLTGKTPFDAKELLAAGLDEMRRTIREVEPVKPSTRLTQELVAADVRRLTSNSESRDPKSEEKIRASSRRLLQEVRGDLDWIVMKCLEKDRARRYETANGLATDIGRHLSNEPIVARPPSRLYRFQKSVQRNKLAFGAATAVALALVIGFAVSTAMYFKAQAEKKKAQTEAARSEQVAQFMKDMLTSVAPAKARGRDTALMQAILKETTARIRKNLANEPRVEWELRDLIALTYHELGLYEPLAALAEENLQFALSHLPTDRNYAANSREQLGDALMHLGDLARSETLHRDALREFEALFGPESEQVAGCSHDLAAVLEKRGKLLEAEDFERKTIAIRRKLPHPERNLALARTLQNLGSLVFDRGQLDQAEKLYWEAYVVTTNVLGLDHLEMGELEHNLGGVSLARGKLDEAAKRFHAALDLKKRFIDGDHPTVAATLRSLSGVRDRQGRREEAKALGLDALGMLQRLYGKTNSLTLPALFDLGIVEAKQKDYEAAEGHFRMAAGILTKDLGERARALFSLARILRLQGKWEESQTNYVQAIALQKQVYGDRHSDITQSFSELGEVYAAQGQWSAAQDAWREAADGGDSESMNALAWSMATAPDASFRNGAAAVGYAEKAVAAIKRQDSAFLDTLAAAYGEAGRFDDAVRVQKEALALVKAEAEKEDLALRLRLYETGKPWRDPSPLPLQAVDLLNRREFAAAEPLVRENLTLCEAQMPDHWRTFEARVLLGAALLGQKRFADAEQLLSAGCEGLRQREGQIPTAGKPAILKGALKALMQLYQETNRPEEAAKWRTKHDEIPGP